MINKWYSKKARSYGLNMGEFSMGGLMHIEIDNKIEWVLLGWPGLLEPSCIQ